MTLTGLADGIGADGFAGEATAGSGKGFKLIISGVAFLTSAGAAALGFNGSSPMSSTTVLLGSSGKSLLAINASSLSSVGITGQDSGSGLGCWALGSGASFAAAGAEVGTKTGLTIRVPVILPRIREPNSRASIANRAIVTTNSPIEVRNHGLSGFFERSN